MLDVSKKFQKRIVDSLQFVGQDKTAAAYAKVADVQLNTMEDRGINAGIMKSFKTKVMDSDEGRAFMTTNNYGPYLPELWPIITAWYPEFPLKELISVQDMEQDLAYIITSELLAGTNKADTTMGEKVETPTGPRTIHGRYPTGEIFGEELSASNDDLVIDTSAHTTTGALAYYPLMTDQDALESVHVKAIVTGITDPVEDFSFPIVNAGIMTMTSVSQPTIIVTIEIATGVITVTSDAVTKLEVSYTWNIEYANDSNIPSVVEDMKMVPIQAKPRVLAMKWTVFSEFVKKKQFGLDIRTQTTKRVLDLMYQYQVRYVLDRMYLGARGNAATITIPSTTLDLNLKVQQVLELLNAQSQVVQANTGRIEGNRLVIGSNFKSFLESLPNTYYKPEVSKDYGFNGPRKIGTFGRYVVFYDDKLAANKGWMTYRGNEWYDAAFYLGVFLPLAPTDAINININVRQAFVEMCAYRYDKPEAVIPLTFA